MSYFFVICTFLLLLIDHLFTNKYQIPIYEQEKYQLYIENHNHPSIHKEHLKPLAVVKWNENLENLIYALSAQLHLQKMVLKPQSVFLYGQTENTKTFNLFWEKLKLAQLFKSMELIHWQQLRFNSWTYVIQIGF